MTTLLLTSAALLGLLAFFEPCTIATHTLFSVRAHQQAGRHCCQNLDGRELLNRAAQGSPYLTAVLLFGAALYLLVPSLGVDTEMLKATLQHASWAGIGLSLLAGFVFSFNPVSFASIPVMLAYVTKAHEERRAVLMGAAFVAGMIVTHIVLGVTAALGGEWVQHVMGRAWGLFLGPLLIVLGLI